MIKVALLMGGPSPEHEVSLKTGAIIAQTLDRTRYDVQEIVIPKNGEWEIPHGIDVAFIAMHGVYGEDGAVQSLLEEKRIPYTGSGASASALAMDKLKSLEVFARNGLNVAPHAVITKIDYEAKREEIVERIKEFGFPCVVKPVQCGSSVGISILDNDSGLKKALEQGFAYGPSLLIERYIKGREFTCGVLEENGNPRALPPTEIIPGEASFFNYEAKYTPGATREITPPEDVTPDLIEKIQHAALRAHEAIGCSAMSRTDMIFSDNTLYILEINTIPGMTETSLYPQAAAAAGIPFSLLLDKVINAAFRKTQLS